MPRKMSDTMHSPSTDVISAKVRPEDRAYTGLVRPIEGQRSLEQQSSPLEQDHFHGQPLGSTV